MYDKEEIGAPLVKTSLAQLPAAASPRDLLNIVWKMTVLTDFPQAPPTSQPCASLLLSKGCWGILAPWHKLLLSLPLLQTHTLPFWGVSSWEGWAVPRLSVTQTLGDKQQVTLGFLLLA